MGRGRGRGHDQLAAGWGHEGAHNGEDRREKSRTEGSPP